jgi:hypothetical protein
VLQEVSPRPGRTTVALGLRACRGFADLADVGDDGFYASSPVAALEVQLIEMPDETALAGYVQDPARADLARTHDRDAVIARTQVLRVEPR